MKRIYKIIACAGSMLCLNATIIAQPINIGGYNVYYGSLHNHTAYSDGSGTPTEAYAYARNVGQQDFFALADHGEMLSSTEWNNIKTAANAAYVEGVFTTFYGFEWSSFWTYGHVAVINTEDYCGYPGVGSFNALLTWINARNGIAFFNHPGWDNLAYTEFDHFTDTPSSKFVGIELWNDHDGFGTYYYNDGFYSNDGNKNYYNEALVRGWKIGASGADDNHSATWGTATDMRMAVLANANTRTDIMNALTARRFYSTTDKNIGLSFKINGAEMGSSIPAGNYTASIAASDLNNELFTQVQLIKNGAVLNTWNIYETAPAYSYDITSAMGDYFYVKVTQVDGNEAISSPVYITAPANLPPTVALTAPTNGASYYTGATVLMAATASDPDGSVVKVEFFQGTTKVGEDLSSPYEYSWTNVQNGSYVLSAKATDNLGLTAVSGNVNITVTNPPSMVVVESRIAAGSDDAEENKSGTVVVNGDDLELVYDTKTTGNQVVGLRFTDLNIPQGATITKAYIQFTTDEKSTGNCNLKIQGEASDNSQPFMATSQNVSARGRTTASATWVPAGWNTIGASGTAQRTPELMSIIQEIVNRPSYETAGGLGIIITGTGKRTAESYEGLPAKAALMHVEYTATRAAITPEPTLTTTNDENTINITVYPNPSDGLLNIVIGNSEPGLYEVICYNSMGALIQKISTAGKTEFIFDCSALKPGIYILRVNSGNLTGVTRFIRK